MPFSCNQVINHRSRKQALSWMVNITNRQIFLSWHLFPSRQHLLIWRTSLRIQERWREVCHFELSCGCWWEALISMVVIREYARSELIIRNGSLQELAECEEHRICSVITLYSSVSLWYVHLRRDDKADVFPTSRQGWWWLIYCTSSTQGLPSLHKKLSIKLSKWSTLWKSLLERGRIQCSLWTRGSPKSRPYMDIYWAENLRPLIQITIDLQSRQVASSCTALTHC